MKSNPIQINMTKHVIIACLAAGFIGFSCGTKKEEDHSEAGWTELDGFHDVMAASYHPVADSGNMAPARLLAGKLDSAARVLAASEVPSEQAGEETMQRLNVLRDSCAAFRIRVEEGKPDSVLRPSLTRLHHVFHELMEGGRGKHH